MPNVMQVTGILKRVKIPVILYALCHAQVCVPMCMYVCVCVGDDDKKTTHKN